MGNGSSDDTKSPADDRKKSQFYAITWGLLTFVFAFALGAQFSQIDHSVDTSDWGDNSARFALLLTGAWIVLNIVSPFVSPQNPDIATMPNVTYSLLFLLAVSLTITVFTKNRGLVMKNVFPKLWDEIAQ